MAKLINSEWLIHTFEVAKTDPKAFSIGNDKYLSVEYILEVIKYAPEAGDTTE